MKRHLTSKVKARGPLRPSTAFLRRWGAAFKTRWGTAWVRVTIGLLTLSAALSAAFIWRSELSLAVRTPPPQLELTTLQARAPLPSLAIGDVILRQGVSVDSALIGQLSSSIYSHVGMVAQVSPEITVIHATTGDDAGAPHAGVVEVSLDAFVHEAYALAIVRFELTATEQAAVQTALRQRLGQEFILTDSAQRNYCSTLVADVLTPYQELTLKPLHLNLPLIEGDYLFPQAFLDAPQGKLIYRYPAASYPTSD